ncbi:MAG: 4-hydroxythreonine-4-phosphate dehydrogenase PdxA [Thermodesulfovibrionales bacterium]|nr:4-hydroxythreonine-4-phosphate dehydrogenase PdxA [Thermodesulfovibrionales bacterium]
MRKKLAITIGDPSGVGPEVLIKALNSKGLLSALSDIFIVGDSAVIKRAIMLVKPDFNINALKIIETGIITHTNFKTNSPNKQCGEAALSYIKMAVDIALKGDVSAIVTAPISKTSISLAGSTFKGHTEMLADLTNTKDYAMMFYGKPLKIILVTIHEAIKDVPKLLDKENILKTIRLAQKGCKMFGIKSPKIAVSGLNPHNGEGGIFGTEEIDFIIPAIQQAKIEGIDAIGPIPPDVVFHHAYKGVYDIVVCMYHDQGLIPLKMIAFDRGVNITVGLPFVRTSPDHGTAYDIAWKGIADPSSMIQAIKTARRLRVNT